MSLAAILMTAACLAAGCAAPAEAATIAPPGLEPGVGDVVEAGGPRCGQHARYVRGHRSRRDGHWIAGHCVRKLPVEPVDHSCHSPGGTSTGSGCERRRTAK